MTWNENGWQNGTLDTLIMIGIDADLFLLCTEWILTCFDGLQLVVTLKIWPTPNATINDMRQTFAMGDLK